MEPTDLAVHPWTLDWWKRLPDAYRAADAVQAAPRLYQLGLNSVPTFESDIDGWTVTPVEQAEDQMTVKLVRSFFGLDRTRPLTLQMWWTADGPGGTVTLNLTDSTGTDLGTDVTDPAPEGDGEAALTVALVHAEPVTATVTITAPWNDLGLLFTIRAINVGYREVTYEELTGGADVGRYPLLCFMEGVGRIAGQVREISDGLWEGTYLQPENTPDVALRWVAQLMGVPVTIRNQTLDELREYLVDLAVNGRPASGTRGDIANAARKYLTGEKRTIVLPGSTQHSLVLLVRQDELPGAGTDAPAALATLVAGVRSTGVVPAGHKLSAQIAAPTWDQWMAAAGPTWTTREAATRTWTDADSLGVTITG